MHIYFFCYIVCCVGLFVFGRCVDVRTKHLLALAFNVAVRTEVEEVLLKEFFPFVARERPTFVAECGTRRPSPVLTYHTIRGAGG